MDTGYERSVEPPAFDKLETEMIKPRDSRRQKLYSSEWAIIAKFRDDPKVYRKKPLEPMRVEEVQKYYDKLTGSAWWLRRYGRVRIWVGDGRGRSRACCSGFGPYYEIRLPRWARRDWVVILHELSHAATIQLHGLTRVAAHGREFAAIQLELVRKELGYEVWKALRQSFLDHGVQFKKKRRMSEETKKQLRERGMKLAAIAAAKREDTQ